MGRHSQGPGPRTKPGQPLGGDGGEGSRPTIALLVEGHLCRGGEIKRPHGEFTIVVVRPRSICSEDGDARKNSRVARRNLVLPTQNRSRETIDGRAVPEMSCGAIKAQELGRKQDGGERFTPPPPTPPNIFELLQSR